MKEIKTPEEILDFYPFDETTYEKYYDYDTVIKAMKENAEQYKYDYSKNCECGSTRTGETWCCNECGLPVTKEIPELEFKYISEELKMHIKIISEYDGWVYREGLFDEPHFNLYKDGNLINKRLFSKMKYHSDERWLNPVAKRVKEDLKQYRNNHMLYADAEWRLSGIDMAAASFDINQLFTAVVKGIIFINHYQVIK